jgi:hypothetical protein
MRNWGSSVISVYAMGWMTRVQFLAAGASIFSLSPHFVQTGSGAYPGSYTMGTGNSYPKDKVVVV